jgi:hypothetical protein
MNAVAFGKSMTLGARINAIYSSDIGHFDVVDMRDPLPEAYKPVEEGHITEDDFRDFVFADAVRLWGTQNPRCFEGTAAAKEAAPLKNSASLPPRGEIAEPWASARTERKRPGASLRLPGNFVHPSYTALSVLATLRRSGSCRLRVRVSRTDSPARKRWPGSY